MTRFVSTAWVPRTSAEFEASSALRIHAKARRTTAEYPLHIYVLEGYEKLEAPYIDHLRDAHIHLHDATAVMAEVLQDYAALNEITSPYDVRCFVRWFVIERLCPGERLIHYDLDLFFRPDLNGIAGILAGCEGTLGSPCITVTTTEWLRVYREMVGRLITDRAGLQAELGHGGTRIRKDIESDQDLTSALELKGGILPQKVLGLDQWAVFNNPLWAPQALGRPVTYRSDDDFAGKPVLFWHIQNGFAEYISRFAAMTLWPHPALPDVKIRLGAPQPKLNPSAETIAFHLLRHQTHTLLRQRWPRETALSLPHDGKQLDLIFTRAWVANAFIIEGRFREIFSHDVWWDEGGFVRPDAASPSGYF